MLSKAFYRVGKCALVVVGSHKHPLFDLILLSFGAAWNIWGCGPKSFIHILRRFRRDEHAMGPSGSLCHQRWDFELQVHMALRLEANAGSAKVEGRTAIICMVRICHMPLYTSQTLQLGDHPHPLHMYVSLYTSVCFQCMPSAGTRH